MQKTLICQGREVSQEQLEWLQNWIEAHRHFSRRALAKNLCEHWNWKTATGVLKDFAARDFLEKLCKQNLISLPPIRKQHRTYYFQPVVKAQLELQWQPLVNEPIHGSLKDLTPLKVFLVESGSLEDERFSLYLKKYHYLSFNKTAGETLKYLVVDNEDRDVACLLFGACAWKTKPRDDFIGWSPLARQKNLALLVNNQRYLILPWVKVKHLASHILSLILKRLNQDWQKRYHHRVVMAETFVEKGRFKGSCYKAANWTYVGQTKGRSRDDRYNNLQVPIKDIYLYPLTKNYHKELCDVHS